MHLNLIADAWRRLGVLKVLHSVLLMNVVLGPTRGLGARIRVDATDSLPRVVGLLGVWWS